MSTPIRIGAIAGEYMEAVLVVAWHAKVGDRVAEGAPLLTIETAKAATEVPAPVGGILTAISAEAGQEVPIDTVLGLIGETAGDGAAEPAPAAAPASPVRPVAKTVRTMQQSGRIIASPYARKEAKRRGIELRSLAASSPSGRIKARDLGAARTERSSVHVLREATGTPLVAIHGFAADANAWRPLMRALPGRKIVAIELPAHGSSPQGVPRDFAALAHSVIAAFDALGASRVHLIGHSLGAAVCLALAEARPETLASLTLIAPAGLGPEIWGAGIAGVARASGAASLGPWLKAMVGNEAMFTPELVAAAASLRTDPAMREAQATLAERLFPDGTQAFDMRNALAGLTMPARLLWGRADKVIPWSHALGAPPHAGLHLLPGIGHMPHMEAPAEVARIVTELIRATGEGS